MFDAGTGGIRDRLTCHRLRFQQESMPGISVAVAWRPAQGSMAPTGLRSLLATTVTVR
ncbi:hypothetical protein YT1_p10099 (plasmid) [Rhodococcus ruber]|nr:hypothetical protein YT1_p10099 [Rhodococcus ruber]